MDVDELGEVDVLQFLEQQPTYREMQVLCRSLGVHAGGRKVDLEHRLRNHAVRPHDQCREEDVDGDVLGMDQDGMVVSPTAEDQEQMPSVRSLVSLWLREEGLQKYEENFAGVSEEEFLSLQIQDYELYGVLKSDKEAMFRLIKKVNAKQQRIAPADKWFSEGGPLIDIYETDDFDFRQKQHLHRQQYGGAVGVMGGVGSLAAQGGVEVPTAQQFREQPKIRVVIRKRPMMQKEYDRGEDDIAVVDPADNSVTIHEPKVKVDLTNYTEYHRFVFDSALDEGVSNDEVYRSTVQPLVGSVFNRGKATCFAYGQTGSGKTYTMSPLPIRTAADMFSVLARPEYQHLGLFVSCFEIYGGKLFDLLNSKEPLICLEDARRNVCIKGLKEYAVEHLPTLEQLIKVAESCRSTGTTGANDQSSRSHSIMQFALKEVDGRPHGGKVAGKISFIDLAGSERGADTFDNDKQTRLEGAEINKSLLALKECIRALDMDQRHIPFRGSKLTEVLRDSFQGAGARLVMIGNVSPNSASCEHTLNTLRYADRVKELRKDRSDRSAGGVTPGQTGYKMAATRGRQQAKAPSLPGVPERGNYHSDAPPLASGPALSSSHYRGDKPVAAPQLHKRAANSKEAREERTIQRVRTEDAQLRAQSDLGPDRYWSDADRSADGGRPSHGQLGEVRQQHLRPAKVSAAEKAMRASEGSHRLPQGLGDDVDQLLDPMLDRNHLIEDIFQEEEELIQVHRTHLETNMVLMKQDMALLQYVDEPGSSLAQYVLELRDLVKQRMESNQVLLHRLDAFRGKLEQSQAQQARHRE